MAFMVENHETAARPASEPRDNRLCRGRTENILKTLIGLFRQPTVIIDLEANRDDLRQSKAIAVAVVMAVPLWALIALGIARVFR
jgi:hypothetical protein